MLEHTGTDPNLAFEQDFDQRLILLERLVTTTPLCDRLFTWEMDPKEAKKQSMNQLYGLIALVLMLVVSAWWRRW